MEASKSQREFNINILTVVFMEARSTESDPTETNCPTGGTVNGPEREN